jgi:RHS repeat-associated protein
VSGDKNKYLFNDGAERQEDLGLNIDLTKYRAYDPAIGRWWQIDPKADVDNLVSWTPYNYSYNNPIRWNDPLGDCPDCDYAWGLFKSEVEKAFAPVKNAIDNSIKAVNDGIEAVGETISEFNAPQVVIVGESDGEYYPPNPDAPTLFADKKDVKDAFSALGALGKNQSMQGYLDGKKQPSEKRAMSTGKSAADGSNSEPETPQPASSTYKETTIYGGWNGAPRDSAVTVTKVITGSDTAIVDKEVKKY